MSRLAVLTAGVLAIACSSPSRRRAAVPSSDATVTKKRCKKGKTRNRSGKCVKKKKRYTGAVPSDNAIGYNSGDGVAFVEITKNRTRISALRQGAAGEADLRAERRTAVPRAAGPQAHVYGMKLNPRTGAFSGTAPASDGGDGDSRMQGRFLEPDPADGDHHGDQHRRLRSRGRHLRRHGHGHGDAEGAE